MNATRPSHIPSCDVTPVPGRRRWRAVLPLLAAVTLLPVPATAQEVRARDLSIVENVLVETIQLALQETIEEINRENVQAQEVARQDDQPVPLRYVFRSGGPTLARGIYLEDYGAIFTVQVPAMSYSARAIYSGSGRGVALPALGEEAQMRVQMSRMGSEIAIMRRRLESEVATTGEDSELATTLRNSLQAWESSFAEMQQAYTEYLARQEREAASLRQQIVSSDDAREREGELSARIGTLRALTSATPEELAAAEALAVDQRNQIEGTIINSVIDTLGQYGRIMHGLNEDDRLAVVLLPSSYLNPVVSWSRATQRDQEFIISVRYGDILDLAEGDLAEEDFTGRVRIERRLGQQRNP